jgi:hypothetical protein
VHFQRHFSLFPAVPESDSRYHGNAVRNHLILYMLYGNIAVEPVLPCECRDSLAIKWKQKTKKRYGYNECNKFFHFDLLYLGNSDAGIGLTLATSGFMLVIAVVIKATSAFFSLLVSPRGTIRGERLGSPVLPPLS